MQKRDNRSLLSRIIGTSPQPDDQDSDYTEEEYEELVDESEVVGDEGDDTADGLHEQNEEIASGSGVSVTQEQPVSNAGGWMADYEGQLNIDMYQTKDNVIIKSTIAGARASDLNITVANDVVTIKGFRHREEEINQEDYFYQECYWGSFLRTVIVPVDIDSEHIEADLKDGILTIVIPKAAKAKTKQVKVRGL